MFLVSMILFSFSYLSYSCLELGSRIPMSMFGCFNWEGISPFAIVKKSTLLKVTPLANKNIPLLALSLSFIGVLTTILHTWSYSRLFSQQLIDYGYNVFESTKMVSILPQGNFWTNNTLQIGLDSGLYSLLVFAVEKITVDFSGYISSVERSESHFTIGYRTIQVFFEVWLNMESVSPRLSYSPVLCTLLCPTLHCPTLLCPTVLYFTQFYPFNITLWTVWYTQLSSNSYMLQTLSWWVWGHVSRTFVKVMIIRASCTF